MKKLISMLLVLIMVLSAAAGAFALDYPDTYTIYMESKYYSPTTCYAYISGFDSYTDTIDKSTVKSSKPSVARIMSVNRHLTTYESTDPDMVDYTELYYSIGIRPKKAGSTTISFKCNNQTYKFLFKALAYKNPVGSMKVTGINNGKELKKETANYSEVPVTVTKASSAPVMKVKAASGWKIMGYIFRNNSTEEYQHRSFGSGSRCPGSLTVTLSAIEKDDDFSLAVTYYNISTKATIQIVYTNGGQG